MKSKKFGFSLIELLISLIVISLIAAAFSPVISKKLKSGGLSIGVGFGGGGSGGLSIGSISIDCDDIDEDCNLCSGNSCLICSKDCNSQGEYINASTCKCENCADIEHAQTCEYNPEYNKGVATLCDDGYYVEDTKGDNFGTCQLCPQGYICHGKAKGLCDPGSYYNNGSCSPCPAGSYCTGDTPPIPCAPGTYQKLAGQVSCNSCPDLTYASNEGAVSCLSCTDGCASCDKTTGYCNSCLQGYHMEEDTNSCYPEMEILGTASGYWTMKDPGAIGGPSIPNAVNICTAGAACSGGGSSATCWQGNTGGADRNNSTGIDGCTRTICNWYAANLICANVGMGLPTSTQLQTLGTNPSPIYMGVSTGSSGTKNTSFWYIPMQNIEYNAAGVNLCSTYGSSATYSKCPDSAGACAGAGQSQRCAPSIVWGASKDNTNAYWGGFRTVKADTSNKNYENHSPTNRNGLFILNGNVTGTYRSDLSGYGLAPNPGYVEFQTSDKTNAHKVRCVK